MAAEHAEFVTADGVRITRTAESFDPARLGEIAAAADTRRGGVLSSGMEYPGRYSRWHLAYVDPCAEITAAGPLACTGPFACAGSACPAGSTRAPWG